MHPLLTRFLLAFAISVAGSSTALAQLAAPPIPPPPSAATLGKFGEIPVSLYTGTPSIEVPLYTIKTKRHTVPISLAYHASGIHVEEEASYVGLGWALNAGGVITRSIHDADDLQEYNTGSGGKTGYASANHLSLPAWTTDGTNRYAWQGKSPTQQGQDLNYFCDNTQDTQPDIFYYNFQGHSGKFSLERSSNSSTLLTHVESQAENLLIEQISINGKICWQIKPDDGYAYVFAERETTRARTESNTTTNTNGAPSFSIPADLTYTSSWFLSTIVAPDGETITFNYDRNSSYQTFQIKNLSTRALVDTYKSCPSIAVNPTNSYETKSYSWQMVTTAPILSSIEYKTGRVSFTSATRNDLVGGSTNGPAKCITGLLVYSGTGALTPFVKGINFIQSYFSNPNANSSNALAYLRLRLDAVQEYGAGAGSDPTYSFGYNYYASNDATSLPRKDSYAKDHYGYFNGASANDANDALLPRTTFTITHPDGTTNTFGSTPAKDANRDYNGQYATIGCLTSIKYPTRGTTTFEFESNTYLDPITNASVVGPGIRIKNITSSSDATSPVQIKSFLYTTADGKSSGKLMSALDYFNIELHTYTSTDTRCQDKDAQGNPIPGSVAFYEWVANRFATSTNPMGTAAQGRPLGYSIVTQLDGVKDANGNLGFRNGKIEYSYGNAPEIPAGAPYIPGTPNNIPPGNGLLSRQTTFKCTRPATTSFAATYQKLQDVTYQYITSDLYSTKGAVFRPHSCLSDKDEFILDDGRATNISAGYPLSEIVRYYDNYYYWQKKTAVTEVTYDQYDETKYTTASTAYTYGNAQHHQPTLTTKTLTDGQVVRDYAAYPSDYSSSASPTLSAMAGSLRLLTQPVETFSTLTKPGGSENVFSGTYIHYALTGPGNQVAVPTQVDQLRLSTPLAFGNFQRSTSGLNPDPNYQPEQFFSYDPGTSNAIGLRKANDVLTSYQWSYTAQLPVAVFRNADRTPPVSNDLTCGNEASSIGFESNVAADNTAEEDYWRNLNVPAANGTFSTTAHTGKFAWRMGPATNGANYGPTRVFQPARQQQLYRFSAWVKTDAGFSNSAGNLTISVNDANGNYLNCAECYKSTSFNDSQGQWQYIETLVDLSAVHSQTGIATSTPVKVVAYTYNTGGTAYLIDDVRFQPVGAATTTYTYDAESRQPTSISDARSYPAYYEYDAQRRLLIIKDHRMGIKKHFEYHYQQQ